MLKIALIIAGSMLTFIILVFAAYTIFFPLVRTIGGGFQILRMYGLKKYRETSLVKTPAFLTPDLELGLTMADGGEKTENPEKTEKGQEAVTKKTGSKS